MQFFEFFYSKQELNKKLIGKSTTTSNGKITVSSKNTQCADYKVQIQKYNKVDDNINISDTFFYQDQN